MQRQDNDGEKHVAFSSASDESNDDEEVKALRATLEEKDQRLSALEAKFDSFSNVGTRGQIRQLFKRAKGRQQQAQEAGEEE
jgi:hypothetical protein